MAANEAPGGEVETTIAKFGRESSAMSTSSSRSSFGSIFGNGLLIPGITPANVLLFSSLPFAGGAYIGYLREVKRASDAAAASSSVRVSGDSTHVPGTGVGGSTRGALDRFVEGRMGQIAGGENGVARRGAAPAASATIEAAVGASINPEGPFLAARALALGTMLSIGGVGLLSGAVFYASGFESVEQLIDTLREWMPQRRRDFEVFIGKKTTNEAHPDLKATAGMTEDEELEYLKRKYLPELYDDDE